MCSIACIWNSFLWIWEYSLRYQSTVWKWIQNCCRKLVYIGDKSDRERNYLSHYSSNGNQKSTMNNVLFHCNYIISKQRYCFFKKYAILSPYSNNNPLSDLCCSTFEQYVTWTLVSESIVYPTKENLILSEVRFINILPERS